MRTSRAITVLAVLLMVTFALPALCVSLPMSMTMPADTMTGGCDGHHHHGTVPDPAHRCCSAGSHVPAAIKAAPVPIALRVVSGHATDDDILPSPTGMYAVTPFAGSPPPPCVLRI